MYVLPPKLAQPISAVVGWGAGLLAALQFLAAVFFMLRARAFVNPIREYLRRTKALAGSFDADSQPQEDATRSTRCVYIST